MNKKLDKHTEILNSHSQILSEHSKILSTLYHLSQVNKVEHDRMFNDMAHNIKGEIGSIRKDLAAVEIVTARNMENIAHLKLIK